MTFIKREEGQGLVEYALLLVLIAVVVIGALFLLGDEVRSVYARVIGALGGGGFYTYQLQGSPRIAKSSPTATTCRLTAQPMAVKVTEAGVPVDALPVTASVSISGLGSQSFSATTNAGGIASWTGQYYTVGVSCGSVPGTATLTVAGGALTASVPIN